MNSIEIIGDLHVAGTFVMLATGGGDQMQKIDFRHGGFDDSNLAIAVKKIAGGEGLAHIGYVNSKMR